MKENHHSYRRNFCSCEKMPEKNSGMYRIRNLDLCDNSAALCQLSQQANWQHYVELVRYKPVKEYGVMQYLKDDENFKHKP